MFRKVLLTAAATLTMAVVPSDAAAQSRQPPPQDEYGARVVSEYRLGVYGYNTSRGFRVSSVVVGSPATRLIGQNGVRYTLETGDYITEVDGRAINLGWTLQQAIAASAGVVDLEVWDTRHRTHRDFDDVRLQRRR